MVNLHTMSAYLPDELPGFEARTLALPREGDGELAVTLVRLSATRKTAGPAILYVHGFCDYFFQSFVAEAFVAAGFSFHAIDLRRYGRSLRPKNLPNFVRSLDEYFFELTWALESIEAEQGGPVLVLAHSTGCLSTLLYAKRGRRRDLIQGLILNSPFLEFATKPPLRDLLPAVVALGAGAPRLPLPFSLGGTYGKSLHRSMSGEWDYDLKKKPLSGFAIRAGWVRAISLAHAEVKRGLNLALPILLMHSARSYPPNGPLTEEAHLADAVLDVEDMKRIGPGLGPAVELCSIPNGKHDLFLSRKEPRELAVETAVRFAQGIVDGA
jgi:alpha-beta hydrolase superfamily lysophospholipase